MATIIRRSGELGDPILKRIPFPEPGPEAKARVSALSFQGLGNGEAVTRLDDAIEGGNAFTPGTGEPPAYHVLGSGVPVFDMRSSASGAASGASTLYRPAEGETVRTAIAVGRIRAMPTQEPGGGGSGIDRVGSIIRSGGWNGSLHVNSLNAASNPGRLAAHGDGTQQLVGPEMSPTWDLHFFAVVYDGTNSHLHYDGEITRGTLQPVAGRGFFMGFSASGFQFQVVEAAQYAVPLTEAQVQEKRRHYRNVYPF